ncbi:MAG: hypothetical protein A2Z73_00460 [Deltaproteobacteria bacterium RBG_13_60_28]|nr:MAG: hypothetical protein A2Z73_00460 [Deltaproteobacteria bacterium RBG_13_60_28]
MSAQRIRGKDLFFNWAGPVCIALIFCALTVWTWRKWPDLLVDFGRELYVPWRIVGGDTLYKDIAYLNGPLSPYLNALCFKLFGVSLTTLILTNLLFLAIFTGLLFILLKGMAGQWTAVMGSLVFLTVFGFAQLKLIGNYNYISPYSHELTHGLLLSASIIYLLLAYLRRRQPAFLLLAGLMYGAVFLGKGEVFLAVTLAAVSGFWLIFLGSKGEPNQQFGILLFALGSMAMPLCFLIFLAVQMPLAEALRGIGGIWLNLMHTQVANLQFYRKIMGIDHPLENILRIIKEFSQVAFLAGMLVAVDLAWKGIRKPFNLLAAAVGGLIFLLWIREQPMPWLLKERALTLVALGGVATAMWLIVQRRHDPPQILRLAPLLLWSALALGLLGKMILNPRVSHYGFALAMPAVLLLVVILCWLIPYILGNIKPLGRIYQVTLSILIIFDVVFFLNISHYCYSRKNMEIGKGGDRFITYGREFDPKGYQVEQLLQKIQEDIPAASHIAVLPEGVMVNYLTRRRSSLRFITFMPPELIIYGEGAILGAFKKQPPDFVVLMDKDTAEYGTDFFGASAAYGKKIMDWINNNYAPIWLAPADFSRDDNCGMKILRLQEAK